MVVAEGLKKRKINLSADGARQLPLHRGAWEYAK